MKLHWIALSPYARKVIIVAREHHLLDKIELVETKVTPPNAELMRFNPLNKVPTLVLDDGRALYDSVVICEYLDSIGSGPKLFPPSGPARWDALRRHALGAGFADLLISWRVESTSPPAQQAQDRLDKYALKTTHVLAALEREMHVQREPLDIGDLAIGCALAYLNFRFAHLAPKSESALSRWFARFEARPSALATRLPAPSLEVL